MGVFDGCGEESRRSAPAAGGNVVMIIRHAEKPDGSGSPHGVDSEGNHDSHSLIVRGWTRAGALVQLFDGVARGGLVRPALVYAAGPGDGGSDDSEGQRPRETVTPLAARLGLTVNTQHSKGDETALVRDCLGHAQPTLICWQHGEIPAILAAFGPVTPVPPAKWPGSRFDLVWVLTPKGSGWAFTQVPQLLLDGDSNQPAH